MAESTYDHIPHPLDSAMEDASHWCGGTEPPTLVEVLSTTSLRVELYESGVDVHSIDASVQPASSTTETVENGGEVDPYIVSRAAARAARVAIGLSPEWKSNFANAIEARRAQQ